MVETAETNAASDLDMDSVYLSVDGETHRLCFTLNVMALAQKDLNWNFFQSGALELNPINLRWMLWALALDAEPGLTIEQAGRWIRPRNMYHVRDTVLAALRKGLPETGPIEASADPNASNDPSPDGSNYGPLGDTTSDSVAPNSGD